MDTLAAGRADVARVVAMKDGIEKAIRDIMNEPDEKRKRRVMRSMAGWMKHYQTELEGMIGDLSH